MLLFITITGRMILEDLSVSALKVFPTMLD
jgi:hypothetical protein